MPTSRFARARTYARAGAPWRRLMPDRTVHRRVQGVDLFLPWSHLLPDYARSSPEYGQNLVQLAAELEAERGDGGGPLRMLDVGSNIGDSAAQVLARTGAEVLCVEGDPYWVRYLRMNLGDEPRARIVEALLLAEDGGDWERAAPLRVGGTTRFVRAAETGSMPGLTIADLRARNPDFDDLRLVKSDTDGFDVVLVPAIASAWRDSGPVLFFEWDPPLARQVDSRDPDRIWAQLADLGYSQLAIWDNGGAPLGQLPISEAAERAATLAAGSARLGYTFWDVAARREEDGEAAAAFDRLVPETFSVAGHRV